MDKLIIRGGKKLKGRVSISGAKNSALPIMAATLLARDKSIIRKVPFLRDVKTMSELLISLGAKVEHRKNGDMIVDTTGVKGYIAPYELVSTMRASVCVMGPLLAREGRAKVSYPGGCVIGPRPIDLHLKGLERLGADIDIKDGYVYLKARELKDANIYLAGTFGSTVLGTANVMMASTLAKGEVVIEGAACEPEIVDLACFLKKMGAKIRGIGSHRIIIKGVKELRGAKHTIIPDRIEAGTYMVAGAITDGEVEIHNVCPWHLDAVIDKLEEGGVSITRDNRIIWVRKGRRFRPLEVTTLPYPGFPTDLQAQIMVMMAITKGISVVWERVYPERFMHVSEFLRMRADILREGPRAIIKGGRKLHGAKVMASDLRASAALVLAGLVAEGTTEISRVYHLDRGYEDMVSKLRNLGADIRREKE